MSSFSLVVLFVVAQRRKRRVTCQASNPKPSLRQDSGIPWQDLYAKTVSFPSGLYSVLYTVQSTTILPALLRLEFQRITVHQNLGSPKVELRFCPWLIMFKYWTGWTDLTLFSVPITCFSSDDQQMRGSFFLTSGIRGLQGDVVFWPIAPLVHVSPNAGGGGLRGLSQWEQLCTSRDMEPK